MIANNNHSDFKIQDKEAFIVRMDSVDLSEEHAPHSPTPHYHASNINGGYGTLQLGLVAVRAFHF